MIASDCDVGWINKLIQMFSNTFKQDFKTRCYCLPNFYNLSVKDISNFRYVWPFNNTLNSASHKIVHTNMPNDSKSDLIALMSKIAFEKPVAKLTQSRGAFTKTAKKETL